MHMGKKQMEQKQPDWIPLYKVDQINNPNPEPEWKANYNRKQCEECAQLLTLIQNDPGHCKSHYCRALNGKAERYCYNKNCYANRWKRARMPMEISDCKHRKPTVWRRINVLQAAGLIHIIREKVRDKWMQRGWDWMKVCYPVEMF